MRAAPLDNTIEIVTPENIAFHYRLAGPIRRLIAYGVDVIIRVVLVLGLATVLLPLLSATIGFGGLGVLSVLIFGVEWLYGGFFEAYMNGQTPAKRMMGLRVLTVDGLPINGLQAMLRNILRAVDWMPLLPVGMGLPVPLFTVGLLTMVLNRRFQRLGDIVCGTMVVMEERRWFTGIARVDERRTETILPKLPTDLVISRTLARSLAAYVERRRNFSLPRRREIAAQLAETLIRRLRLPADTDHDLLLCALYQRAFMAEGVPREAAPRHADPYGDQVTHAVDGSLLVGVPTSPRTGPP
jgi:uncharacterized RDD family membrane protein YckC